MNPFRSVPRFATVLLSATALSLAGCSSSAPSESSSSQEAYPAEVRQTFISSCTLNAAQVSGGSEGDYEEACNCLLEEIEKAVSLEEFEQAEQDLLAGRSTGIDFAALALKCS